MKRNHALILTGISLLAVSSACSLFGPVTKVAYAKDGLTFNYLSNWSVIEDKIQPGTADNRYVKLEGPSHVVLSINRLEGDNSITLEQFISLVEEKRQGMVEGATGMDRPKNFQTAVTGEVRYDIGGKSRRGISKVFEVDPSGNQIPYRCDFFLLEEKGHKWILFGEGASHSWSQFEPGFQTIYDSLRFDVR